MYIINFFVKYIYMYNSLYTNYKKKYLDQTAGLLP